MERQAVEQDPSVLNVEPVVANDPARTTIRLWSDTRRYAVDAELLSDARQSRWVVRIPATASIYQADGSVVCPVSLARLRSLVFGRNMMVVSLADDGLPRYVWLQYLALDRSDPAQETYIVERSVRN